jgi:hypothetical protein
MNYYNNNYCFEEIEQTGDTIRRKNNIKMKNLLSLAVNFIDKETLEKIKEVVIALDPEEIIEFKSYLREKGYLKKGNKDNKSQGVINKIAQIAITSIPKDKTLKEFYVDYNKNLNGIDRLKQAMKNTKDPENLNKMLSILNELSDRNVKIMEKINEYRVKLFNK